jgi:hypothetical protein
MYEGERWGDSLDIKSTTMRQWSDSAGSELRQEQKAQMMPRLRDIVSRNTGEYFRFSRSSLCSLIFEILLSPATTCKFFCSRSSWLSYLRHYVSETGMPLHLSPHPHPHPQMAVINRSPAARSDITCNLRKFGISVPAIPSIHAGWKMLHRT